MMDIRKKLFLVSKLLHPDVPLTFLTENNTFAPHCPSPVHLHPTWHMGFAPVSHRGGVCKPQALTTPARPFPLQKRN